MKVGVLRNFVTKNNSNSCLCVRRLKHFEPLFISFMGLPNLHRLLSVFLYLIAGVWPECKAIDLPKNIVPHWTSITSEALKGFQVQALTVNPKQKLVYISGSYNDTIFYVKRWDGSVWENIGE